MSSARPTSIEPVAGFQSAFDKHRQGLPGAASTSVAAWRARQFGRFLDLGLPSQRLESWKYTNIAKVANQDFVLASRPSVGAGAVAAHFAGGHKARRLIFINGHLSDELSHARGMPDGVSIRSVARALAEDSAAILGVLEETADADDGLAALNAAFTTGGAWITVADNVVCEEPVQLLFLSFGQERAALASPRLVVTLGKGASLKLIESHVALREGQLLTNLVSTIRLGEKATLVHDRVHHGRAGSSFLGRSSFTLGTGANLTSTTASLGGDVVRHSTEARLDGEAIEATFNGLYAPHASEHVDNTLRIHHLRPNSNSNQFYKGIVADKAHAVFAGKIIVHRDAQKTNAFQKNDNLLLSDDAEVDTKPELEIYADDVKCSHGATCGELDEHEVFYLRSRGLDRETAESLVTFAFAGTVLERFADEALKKQVREAVIARLPGGLKLGDLA